MKWRKSKGGKEKHRGEKGALEEDSPVTQGMVLGCDHISRVEKFYLLTM